MRNSCLEIAGLMVVPMLSGRIAHGLFAMLLLCAWNLSASGARTSKGVNFEVQALMSIKASLKDPHGALKNWDKDAVNPCSWTMVTCSSANLVIFLEAPSQNLSGPLSPSIGNLTNLVMLLLQSNDISGNLPPEIGKLSNLIALDLSNNHFFGEIPASFDHLQNLKYVDLSYNNLSGPLPPGFKRTYNIVGNPLICGTGQQKDCFAVPPPGKGRNHKVAIVVGSSIGCFSFLFQTVGLFFCWWWWQRRNKSLGEVKWFSFRELKKATDSFSDNKQLLGKGSFSDVYRGQLPKGLMGRFCNVYCGKLPKGLMDRFCTPVAVKRLMKDGNVYSEEEFQKEVEMISNADDTNVLKLSGFCTTATERLLVYPLMSKGSVESCLKGKPPLDWTTRKHISVGAAKGLEYLHHREIIHRDVKAANILLDDEFNAVVGDFGLAKFLDHRDSQFDTAPHTKVGHIAPEYRSTKKSSEKTDVFGFGILLFELIRGEKEHRPHWVKAMLREQNLDELVDEGLKNTYDEIELEVKVMVKVALWCTLLEPNKRPNMSEVVQILEREEHAEQAEAFQRMVEILEGEELAEQAEAFQRVEPHQGATLT